MDIKIKDIPDIKVISIRYKGEYKEMSKYFEKLFALGKGVASPFALYYDKEYSLDADIEVCLPVGDGADVKLIKGGKFLSLIYEGNYNDLPKGYRKLDEYRKEHNLVCGIPSREVYLKGFKKHITEILIPLKT